MKGHALREDASYVIALPGMTNKRGGPRRYKPHFVRRRVLCHHLARRWHKTMRLVYNKEGSWYLPGSFLCVKHLRMMKKAMPASP